MVINNKEGVKSMKKIYLVLIISIFSLSIILGGCGDRVGAVPKDLKVITTFDISSQDGDFIFADISVKNETEYNFRPEAVLIQMQLVDNKETPLLVEAFHADISNPKDLKYQAKIPKKVFTVLKDTDINNVTLQVRGYFTDKGEKVISGLWQGEQIKIKELLEKK